MLVRHLSCEIFAFGLFMCIVFPAGTMLSLRSLDLELGFSWWCEV